MKDYNIPIIYQSCKNFHVEAENLQEAVEKALKQFFSEPDEMYIEDSFEIDGIVLEDGEDFDMDKLLKN